ncbi:flavoredoxin [Methanobrevibacter cuticularis]|uniref:Flavoredoxin n=1 Tax=Methanobrevibacter cuticularis TaxID=47311 RepID=A0A166DQQ9_9EURY|nr:flavin reductase family protein [Methanobrevibacter cuticularis]KZX15855.1 flavoredoxin [Methanobrevibacter cuticularis]
MKNIDFPVEEFHKILAPRPTVVVTSKDDNGNINAAPFSFVMPVSLDPPLIAISSSPNHDTVKNIEKTEGFTLSIATESIINEVWEMAKEVPSDENELEMAGLSEEPGKSINLPIIEEAIANFECGAVSIEKTGDQKLIIAEIFDISLRSDMIKEGILDVEKAKPLLHINDDIFVIGDHLRKVNE